MGFQIPSSPNQDQFYKEKLPNSIPFHSMKRTLPKVKTYIQSNTKEKFNDP
ncbi:hypothetical protein HanXRQr2_Chr14g0662451 [Helianthus annuus]|uniref:Uncharacterized protein n=1 Tax=Helianthus annuus TaxID=4232 RepID=A0A9K3ECJ9_HELAN|nr:hypothetical protein HanXRQr2_Chr14g0662451 [Helianthus annuus]KAJ0841911.1 hypothetical protein HanPSC8_Chr14g0635751 [Helianthus annuus]